MSEWPPRWTAATWKPSRTASRKAKLEERAERRTKEDTNKRKSKTRDGNRCRFPLCGCKDLGLGLRVESSHQKHKGSGGNPDGSRNVTANLVTLCPHRHRTGLISRHRGTLRPRFLTLKGFDGPIAWEIDIYALRHGQHTAKKWIEIAREVTIQQWEIPAAQQATLQELAEMVA